MNEDLNPLQLLVAQHCAFVLAEDMTEYSPCKWDAKDKTFSTVYGHEEASQADDAVRFYCASCGTGHMVPEGLP